MEPAPPSRAAQLRLESRNGNKAVRSRAERQRQRAAKRAKTAARRARRATHDDDEPRRAPVSVDAARVFDADTGRPLTPAQARAIVDEFTPVLAGETRPRVVLTTGLRPSQAAFDFVRQMLPVLPGSVYYERLESGIAEFAAKAADKGFSDVLVIKDDHAKLSTLTHVHLPTGPTAVYKISSFVRSADIPGHGRCTRHEPEVILNNFTTSLGLRVGRMLGSLFPHHPNFVGRQAATFHNQRDFIFFRFHRYVFGAERDKARLQELGPRFTLKLRALQKGLFTHPHHAQHEFKWTTKTDIDRRRFFL